MKKFVFLFLATMLLTSCQDEFLNEYKDGVSWAYRAYDEIDYLKDAALDYRTAMSLEENEMSKRRIYEEQKQRYNTLLIEMEKYDTKINVSSMNDEKKKEAYSLYHKLYDETKDLIREACWIVEDLDKADINKYRKQKDMVGELHKQINEKYIDAIKAGKNPFK